MHVRDEPVELAVTYNGVQAVNASRLTRETFDAGRYKRGICAAAVHAACEGQCMSVPELCLT